MRFAGLPGVLVHSRIRRGIQVSEVEPALSGEKIPEPPFLTTRTLTFLLRGDSILRHVIEMKAKSVARLTWPIVFRPLHDALIEDSLDKAERNLGQELRASSGSPWVKFLRRELRRGRGRKK
jgi:hypothetical protein